MSDFYVFGYARDKAHYRGKKSFEPKYAITDAPRNSFYLPLISLRDAESVIAQRDVEITLLRKQVEALENADGAEKDDSIKGNQCVPQLRKMEGTKGSAKKMDTPIRPCPCCGSDDVLFTDSGVECQSCGIGTLLDTSGNGDVSAKIWNRRAIPAPKASFWIADLDAKKMGGELAHFPTCLAISPRRTVEKTVPVYLPDEKGDDHDSDT